MKHYIGTVNNENEFHQFKYLTGIQRDLTLVDNRVYCEVSEDIINDPAPYLLCQGRLAGFLIAWRHCERMLQNFMDMALNPDENPNRANPSDVPSTPDPENPNTGA